MESILQELSADLRDFEYGRHVPVLDEPPSPFRFYRDFVAKNRPCVVHGAVEHWPAMKCWDLDYLCKAMGENPVTCTLTPDGKADALKPGPAGQLCFALPHTDRMTMSDFRQQFSSTRSQRQPCVPSVQFQNGNLNAEFPQLASDVDSDVPWATEAFGCQPDAVNVWVGDKRYSTSFHKDHYENIYVVVRGSKTFTLRPPSSVWQMHLASCQVHQHTRAADGSFSLEPVPGATPVAWCPVDVDVIDAGGEAEAAQRAAFPRYFTGPEPLKVTVRAGQLLYLPAMWYHYVQQNELDGDAVMAVNYWYDMAFDGRYAHFRAVERMADLLYSKDPEN